MTRPSCNSPEHMAVFVIQPEAVVDQNAVLDSPPSPKRGLVPARCRPTAHAGRSTRPFGPGAKGSPNGRSRPQHGCLLFCPGCCVEVPCNADNSALPRGPNHPFRDLCVEFEFHDLRAPLPARLRAFRRCLDADHRE
eukprot:366095-Chlamydomonas_euryale.AAC.1